MALPVASPLLLPPNPHVPDSLAHATHALHRLLLPRACPMLAQNELEAITMARADVTQEQGSYDPFLDADDWYIRDLMRSNKKRGL